MYVLYNTNARLALFCDARSWLHVIRWKGHAWRRRKYRVSVYKLNVRVFAGSKKVFGGGWRSSTQKYPLHVSSEPNTAITKINAKKQIVIFFFLLLYLFMKEKTATVREYNKTGFHIFVRYDPSLLDLTIIIISILKKHLK